MESYPQEVAGIVRQLADKARAWALAQAQGNEEAADAAYAGLEALRFHLEQRGVLGADQCQQLVDVAMAAAAVVLCQDLGMEGLEERLLELREACEPQPEELAAPLWRRTRELFAAGARFACAEARSGAAAAWRQRRLYERRACGLSGFGRVGSGRGPKGAAAYAQASSSVIPATVVMLYTCREGFMPHDLSDASDLGMKGSEGVCTSSLVAALGERSDHTLGSLLDRMRQLSSRRGHAPALASSRALEARTPFSVASAASGGRCRVLSIGVNYFNTRCELYGCHADVRALRQHLDDLGCRGAEVRALLDDGSGGEPSRSSILNGFHWLVDGARPGDSLFVHYSGHGATVRDDDWNEEDGTDEALCPSDFEASGNISDEEIFRHLVAPLPEGVLLTCVIDRRQGGTIMELPYLLRAADKQDAEAMQVMQPNASFDFGKLSRALGERPRGSVVA